MPCGLPTRRYFQVIWCSKCPAGCQTQVLSSHLVLEMPCGLPTRRQVLSSHLVPCGLPTRRYFQAIWCLKCPAGCQPLVLSSHLVLEMPCGLPTRRYFQAIWCLKCPGSCQPAGTFNLCGVKPCTLTKKASARAHKPTCHRRRTSNSTTSSTSTITATTSTPTTTTTMTTAVTTAIATAIAIFMMVAQPSVLSHFLLHRYPYVGYQSHMSIQHIDHSSDSWRSCY